MPDHLTGRARKTDPGSDPWDALGGRVLNCRACPRLVAWREGVAADPPRRHRGEKYHARPVPSFGDPAARVLVVGLAPAANGANRTGRMFTGDRSGDWLYRALHRAGFANQPESTGADDGLQLTDCRITAACRCAPPGNKPGREELARCAPFLDEELDLLGPRLRVIVALGSVGLKATLDALRRREGITVPRPAPKFGHGAECDLGPGAPRVLMSFHPSQQNTFTGRLTEPMFDRVWSRAAQLVRG